MERCGRRSWVNVRRVLSAISVVLTTFGATAGSSFQRLSSLPATRPPVLACHTDPCADETIWRDFVLWVRALPRLPPGERARLREEYVRRLVESGVAEGEARRRLTRIDAVRNQSLERQRVYWDGKHKLRDSPPDPLPLVREAVRSLRPGRALDVAMGAGRHSIFLASLGWDVTGYDVSAEGLRAALASAAAAGVRITVVQATHETFDLGRERWDLAILAYPYTDTMDPSWPPRLLRALKPGGTVIFQGVLPEGPGVADVAALWRPFDVVRCEVVDRGEDWFDGQAVRTLKLVVRKPDRPELPRR